MMNWSLSGTALRGLPYFTAEPVITNTEDIRKGDFAMFTGDSFDGIAKALGSLPFIEAKTTLPSKLGPCCLLLGQQ